MWKRQYRHLWNFQIINLNAISHTPHYVHVNETGTFNFTGEKLYHFCLVRQFQLEDEDEFWQLHLNLMYDEEPKIANTYECLWESKGEFFDKILNSEAYKSLIGRDCKCNIYFEET